MCPLCKTILVKDKATFRCEENHSYDLAKEGYLNLLLVNQKSSTDPGDDSGMVTARKNFLQKNYYLPLSNAINKIVINNTKNKKDNSEIKILDCGCGEGYYLKNLKEQYADQNPKMDITGLDISKSAIKMAATSMKNDLFIVSNLNYELPFPDDSFDILLNIFAPKNPIEFSRVMAKNGLLIIVFPTRNHLKSLKESLGVTIDYNSKPDSVMNVFSSKFKLVDTEQIESVINLKAEDAIELIKMTPLYWQVDQKKLDKMKGIATEIGFNIYTFKKIR